MIVLIDGLAGSGKTWLMSRLVKKEWKKGEKIHPNFKLWFDEDASNIKRWHYLDETFNLKRGILVIDESQKFMDARQWQLLPTSFRDKIAMHRHHHLDIYSTTQDLGHIDHRMRSNIHELYHCQTIWRFPRNQKVKPILHIIKSQKKVRSFDGDTYHIKWDKVNTRIHFISKLWTKTYYDTYNDMILDKFLCKVEYERKAKTKPGTWLMKIYSREMVENGKARL
jgi:GTPase SAR1 family protein